MTNNVFYSSIIVSTLLICSIVLSIIFDCLTFPMVALFLSIILIILIILIFIKSKKEKSVISSIIQKSYIKTNQNTGSITESLSTIIDKNETFLSNMRSLSSDVEMNSEFLMKSFENAILNIDLMHGSFKEIYSNMKLQEESIVNTGGALSDAVKSIHSIKNNVYNQSSSIEQTSRTIQLMLDTFVEITETIKQAGEIASNLSIVAGEGGNMIRQTMQSIQSVQLESNNITEIINIIKNISDQTNILSLNASIESAHAGDAGKGFAIVAQEIRRLAQQSTESADKIEKSINKIVSKVQDTSSLAEKSGAALDKLLNGVESTSKIIESISDSVGTQSKNTSDITEAISEMLTGTSDVKQEIDQQASGWEEITRMSEHLKEISTRVGELIKSSYKKIYRVIDSINILGKVAVRNMTATEDIEKTVLKI